MSRLTSAAIILRTRPYGESDLIIDLFTEQIGRTTAVAKGALRSKRRYMGTLEVGHLVKVDYQMKPGLSVLGPCDVLQGVRRVRDQLSALRQLYYVLEICLNSTPYEDRDEALFQSMVELISAIESEPGIDETSLFTWELTLLSHLGYHLKIGRCPFTGLAPDGLSAQAGGAISSAAGKPYWPVKTEALRVLYRLQKRPSSSTDYEQSLSAEDKQDLRAAFVGLWSEITGKNMKTNSIFTQLSLSVQDKPPPSDHSASSSMSAQLLKGSALLIFLCLCSCQGLGERISSTAVFEVQPLRELNKDAGVPSEIEESQENPTFMSELHFELSDPQRPLESTPQSISCHINHDQLGRSLSTALKQESLHIVSAQSDLWVETTLPQEVSTAIRNHQEKLEAYNPFQDFGGLWVLYTALNGETQSLILTKPVPWICERAIVLGRCGSKETLTQLSFTNLNTKRLIEPTRQLKLMTKKL